MKRTLFSSLACVSVLLTLSSDAVAFGKKRKATTVQDTQAYPTRVVLIDKFDETKFMLPDGKTPVDAGISLAEMAPTEVMNATKKFVVGLESGDVDVLNPRYAIQGGVSAFEAEIAGTSIKFGYKKGTGDIGSGKLPSADATVDVKIGKLEMDLRIVDRQRKIVVAAAKGDAKTVGLNLSAKVKFSDFDSGADFMHKSPLSNVFRAVLRQAVAAMAKNPRTNFNMDWSGTVSGVHDGHVYFDKGQVDEVSIGNLFKVYDGQNLIGVLQVDQPDHDQSGAKYKDDAGGKLLEKTGAGDEVRIYFKSSL